MFVTGKGGVGKTTVATALGLAAAARGKRTIVCEVSREERMSRAFGVEEVGYSETELAPNLHTMSVDPQGALVEYLSDQTGSARVGGMLAGNRLFEYFAAAAPGLKELTMVGKVWELAQPQRRNPSDTPYDLVIVDAPASGHGVGMLRTPRTYREVARVGPIRRQAGHIVNFLSDARNCGVVAVSLPMEMAVTETFEVCDHVTDQGIATDAVIVNQLLPERFSAAEAREIEAVAPSNGSPNVAAALRAALSEHRRAGRQQNQLRRLRRRDIPVVTLPFVWEPELGLEELEDLAQELGRKL